MPELIVILFAVLSPADGSPKQVSNVAQAVTTDVCQVIAAELNQSPRKPANVAFGCRVVRTPVEVKS